MTTLPTLKARLQEASGPDHELDKAVEEEREDEAKAWDVMPDDVYLQLLTELQPLANTPDPNTLQEHAERIGRFVATAIRQRGEE